MKYNLADQDEAFKALDYLIELTKKKVVAEVKLVRQHRSLKQNSYLHLLLNAFGSHFGYTLAEAKQLYKELNKEVYYYKRNGHTFIRSSASLDTAEMTKTIDRFRAESEAAGYPLPLATDQDWLRQISNEVERTSHYL